MRVKLLRVIAAWLASLAAFSGLAAAVAPAAHADPGSEEAQFLALTNQLRAGLGIQQLTVNSQLVSMARNWSAQMASAGSISHNPSLTSLAPSNWTNLGENVGVGPAVDVLQTAFINSPEHYANLSKAAYNQVGIGVVDSGGRIWVTVDFMTAPLSGGGGGGGSSAPAPRVATPRTPSAPRTTAATAPRSAAPPATSPPTTLPPAAPTAPARTPVNVKPSPAFPQILQQLRAVDAK
ncbi:MAG: CAP domain-containing protein [Acidimicrobiia bacterium]|nr:CAP domain-containing protein [Acidimicrobiia bacterium]